MKLQTLALLALSLVACTTSATPAEDWADITTGQAGTTVSTGSIGTPSKMVLLGSAFPVVLANDGSSIAMGGARVDLGRVFFWSKEGYYSSLCNTVTACSSPLGRMLVNILRWTGGQAVPAAGSTVTVRLGAHSSIGGSSYFTNLQATAATMGVNIVRPTGSTSSFYISDVSTLSSVVDVYLTTSYVSYTAAQRDSITAFTRAGGGIALGGQAWSTSDTSTYGGNVLLAPLNVVAWTTQYGDSSTTFTIPASPPSQLINNNDIAADAILRHISGAAPLDAATLQAVTKTMTNALKQPMHILLGPSSPSRVLWANYDSNLALQLNNVAQQWVCGSVPGTDPINQLAVAYYNKMMQTADAAQVTALPCVSKFPGLPAAGASTVTSTASVNATYTGTYTGPMPPRGGTKWLSTGLWAPAGQVVTFTISSSVAATLKATGGPLGMQIGSHSDDISAKTNWCRQPYGMLRRYWFSSAAGGNTITASSGVGGLIYVLAEWGNTLGLVDVTISGAIKAPFFYRGKTTAAEWLNERKNPAPWAELATDKLVLTVPSADVATLSNPDEIMSMWDDVMDALADFGSFTHDRPRAERITADCDISAGWMHSGYPIMMYLSATSSLFTNYYGDSIESNKWGPIHELGHNHQYYFNLPNTGETTNNIMVVYAMEMVIKINRTTAHSALAAQRSNSRTTYMASGSFATDWSVWTALDTYLQLQENIAGGDYLSGWNFYKQVMARYLTLESTLNGASDNTKIQTWIIETSNIAGKNLVQFYKDWKFPVDAATEAAVSGLPAWSFNAKADCGATCVQCCLPAAMGFQPPLPPPRDLTPYTTPTQEWWNIMGDLAGVNISMPAGIGAQSPFSLSSATAFPLFSAPSPWVVGQVGQGRVVAMGKENNINVGCGVGDMSLCAGSAGKLTLSTLRWAASYAAPLIVDGAPTSRITIRVGANSGAVASGFFANLTAAAAPLGIDIVYPSGKRNFFLAQSDVLNMGSGQSSAIMDVYITTAYVAYTQLEAQALAAFVTNGGGLVLGGQTWYKYDATTVVNYPGNILLSGMSAGISWLSGYGAWDPKWIVAPKGPAHVVSTTIVPGNGMSLGGSTWRSTKQCADGFWMNGLRTRIMTRSTTADNSALNAVTGKCANNTGGTGSDIISDNGNTGSWGSIVYCPAGAFVKGISMQVLPYSGAALSSPFDPQNDQVAASSVKLVCTDGTELLTSNYLAANFGTWSEVVSCPMAYGVQTVVCGITVNTQTSSSTVDNTALNDIKLLCCLKW